MKMAGPVFPLETRLKDGTAVLIRLLEADDLDDLRSGFEKLSAQSRYFRFLRPVKELSDDQLHYLTEIDNQNHLAICALVADTIPVEGIAVARYIRLKDEPDTAEFAITVIDTYQNLGLGSRLMKLLMEAAAENGIRRFRGYVMENNHAMRAILQQYRIHAQRESGNILRVELPLCQ
jgi:RimJ/RimL family protein N-acetyltransferase